MNTPRPASRAGVRAIVLTAAAAALTAGLPAAAWAAAPAARAAQQTTATAITCNEVSPDLPNVFARDCDSATWGPLSDFTVTDRNSGDAYMCSTGWAEGSLWVSGQDCQPASS